MQLSPLESIEHIDTFNGDGRVEEELEMILEDALAAVLPLLEGSKEHSDVGRK